MTGHQMGNPVMKETHESTTSRYCLSFLGYGMLARISVVNNWMD